MQELRLAEKMYRRTHDAPMSRRNSIDLLFIMQRHAVFTIDQNSADHISNIIFAQQSIEGVDPIKKYELLYEFHSGYDPTHRYDPRPAPKLRKAIGEARVKWAEILRDEDLVDVRVIVLPSEERDFEHVHPPVDLAAHPFGNQLQRFQGLKTQLQEEGGAMPYRLKPRFQDSLTMEVDLVITRAALEQIATPYMQVVLNFRLHPITAPAPHSSVEVEPPVTEELVRHGEFAQLSMEALASILRQRSSSIQQVVRGAPKLPWNFPYSVGSGRPSRQPEWSDDEGPFSKDVFEAESNSNWIEKDFAARRKQIEEWVAAKRAREAALRTREPDPDFILLDGLAGCNTYAPDSAIGWFEAELYDGAMTEYTEALRVKNLEAIRYHEAVANLKALAAQTPQKPDAIEFFRQAVEMRLCILERANEYCAMISQGLPAPLPRPKMKVQMPPMQGLGMPHQVDRTGPERQVKTDHAPTQAAAASETPPSVFSFVMAEPGHTPIPQISRGMKGRALTSWPSARPAQDIQARDVSLQGEDAPTSLPENQAAVGQSEYKLIIGPGGASCKVRKEVSLGLPTDTLAYPNSPPPSPAQKEDENSSSDKENDFPPCSTRLTRRSVTYRQGGKMTTEQDLTSLCRVPSLAHYNGLACKSTPSSPNVSPEIPREFKSLKHAVHKDNTVNHGSPQGMLPALRRMVSGMTGGFA